MNLTVEQNDIFKYVPVFRFRDGEKKTLENVTFSNKILPLLEVVQEKKQKNMNMTCLDEITDYLRSYNKKALIDFPLYIKPKRNTKPNVVNFLSPLLANPTLRINHFNKLIGQNVIPVVSYNPHPQSYQQGYIAAEFSHLRNHFNQLALRIFFSHAQNALQEAASYLKSNDIIILDLDHANHNDEDFSSLYSFVQRYARQRGCKTVLIRSAIDPKLTYTSLTNNLIISSLDNSLLKAYSNLGFDAFGDYCGIKKDDLTNGGAHSPGCIFYHWQTNSYYGHKGVFKQITTFTTHVAPSLVSSTEWTHYQTLSKPSHIHSCPGCKAVQNIINRVERGNSASKWKMITSSHYLHTMEEFL